MKDSLQPGLKFEFQFQVPETKTVPYLYPESPEFQAMPRVLATGYMVGLFEWACIQALNPHLDWPRDRPWASMWPEPHGRHSAGPGGHGPGPSGESGRAQAHLFPGSRRRGGPDFPGIP